jgi:hypothetical protein
MKSLGKTACVFILILSVAMLLMLKLQFSRSLMQEIFPWTRYAYQSDSMKPVEVVLGKAEHLHLFIPGTYFTSLSRDREGISYDVQIEAYLPDMLPRKLYYSRHPEIASGDRAAITELRQSWLFITLTAIDSAGRNGFFKLIEFYKHSFTQRPEDDKSPFEIYDSLPPFDGRGFEYSYNPTRTTVYLPKNSNEYYLLCYGEHTEAYVCNIDFIYQGRIRADVGMKPNNLLRPDYVRKAVSDFISRIMTSP